MEDDSELQPLVAKGKDAREVDVEGFLKLQGSSVSVHTKYGSITVTIVGDRRASPCITYHDVGLNHRSCFQSLLVCSGSRPLLNKNFCFYHIDAPGCQDGATSVPSEALPLTVHKLVDQVSAVVKNFQLKEVVGIGVGAGAYILAKYAAQHPKKMAGLILVSPPCLRPGWLEWVFGNYALYQLGLFGLTDSVKDYLISRLFYSRGPGGNLAMTFKQDMSNRHSNGVKHYLSAVLSRPDLSEDIKDLKCRVLILSGEQSMYRDDSLHLNTIIDHSNAAWVEIPECGCLATEEKANELLSPITLFLTALQQMGYGFGWDLS